jgi:hypothetical protein
MELVRNWSAGVMFRRPHPDQADDRAPAGNEPPVDTRVTRTLA